MSNARMGRATALADITEQKWDGQLFRARHGLVNVLGWSHYHTLRSKGSKPGYPDRTIWRDRVMFAELKTETGKVSDAQVAILTGLAKAGAEVYVWRPSDLDEIAQILTWRGHIVDYGAGAVLHHADTDGEWRPKSLWLPAGHRNDENVQAVIASS